MELHRPSELLNFLSSLNKKPKRSLSQNFLIDKNIVDKMLQAADITAEDIVLEIGPGPGVITKQILSKAKNAIAVEKDNIFAANLDKFSNLEVVNSDFMKTNLTLLKKSDKKLKVISSIPYNLTTPIISKLLENHTLFSSLTLMVQKEVALRIAAQSNSKAFSSFSIFVNFYADIEIISHVSKNSFFPRPKVDSSIIHLRIKDRLPNLSKEKFHKMVRTAFSQRRKKVITSLSSLIKKEKIQKALEKLNIDINARAENLNLEDYLALFKKLF